MNNNKINEEETPKFNVGEFLYFEGKKRIILITGPYGISYPDIPVLTGIDSNGHVGKWGLVKGFVRDATTEEIQEFMKKLKLNYQTKIKLPRETITGLKRAVKKKGASWPF